MNWLKLSIKPDDVKNATLGVIPGLGCVVTAIALTFTAPKTWSGISGGEETSIDTIYTPGAEGMDSTSNVFTYGSDDPILDK